MSPDEERRWRLRARLATPASIKSQSEAALNDIYEEFEVYEHAYNGPRLRRTYDNIIGRQGYSSTPQAKLAWLTISTHASEAWHARRQWLQDQLHRLCLYREVTVEWTLFRGTRPGLMIHLPPRPVVEVNRESTLKLQLREAGAIDVTPDEARYVWLAIKLLRELQPWTREPSIGSPYGPGSGRPTP